MKKFEEHVIIGTNVLMYYIRGDPFNVRHYKTEVSLLQNTSKRARKYFFYIILSRNETT